MDKKIDIIVTYVNASLEEWQNEFKEGKQKEIKNKQGCLTPQSLGDCRFRDGETFKYGFRGVEKNIPGINNIFLVVEDERHIPQGLNQNHPKLKIVYHKDYIPAELLPTFNSNTIEMFFYKIPDLSDLYLLSNDDMFFINPMAKEKFFEKESIVKNKTMTGYRRQTDEFGRTLEQNHKLLVKNKVIQDKYSFVPSHLAEIHKKSLEETFITMNYAEIYRCLSYSHFRHPANYTNGMLSDLLKAQKDVINNADIYKNSYFKNIGADGSFNPKRLENCEIICINDTPKTNFEKAKQLVINFLESKLPEKSTFEK